MSILLFSVSIAMTQNIETTILSVDGERTKFSISKYEYNNHISEIWYCEEENKTLGLSDFDVFAKGLQRNRSIDSVLVFEYDESWNLEKTRILNQYNFDNIVNLVPQNEDDELIGQFNAETTESVYFGRTNEIRIVKVKIKNNLSQNGWIKAKATEKSVVLSKLKVPLSNRSTIILELELTFVPGENTFEVILTNSNDDQRSVTINVVGFHLIADDFVLQDELIHVPELELNSGELTYIEGEGNSKLVRVHGQDDTLEYPLSRKISTLSADLLKTGQYIFELVDLGTNERKYRMVNVN